MCLIFVAVTAYKNILTMRISQFMVDHKTYRGLYSVRGLLMFFLNVSRLSHKQYSFQYLKLVYNQDTFFCGDFIAKFALFMQKARSLSK